jgi:hypothetical protein
MKKHIWLLVCIASSVIVCFCFFLWSMQGLAASGSNAAGNPEGVQEAVNVGLFFGVLAVVSFLQFKRQ